MSANEIVYECVDTALSSFESIDKQTFYQLLRDKYKVSFDRFADEFESIHEALRDCFGVNHYKIERAIIQILNEGAKTGKFDRYTEVQAFGRIVNVFMVETEKNIKRNKTLAIMSSYTKSLETEVKESNEKLQAAERMAAIGETAAMVGHDIRNPLQAIVGELYLEKLEIDTLLDGPTKNNIQENIRSIEENLFYINKIVSDLQDFAKPLKAEKDQVDINEVIADVLSMVSIPQNYQVEIMVEKDFPILEASYQMFKRALTNLIQNAMQAMPNEGKLSIHAYLEHSTAKVSVSDTGEGIPEDVKARLFKPLFTTKAKGQGLGLAVVKRLIEAQGGTVDFESENGNGAKFTLNLPIKKGTK